MPERQYQQTKSDVTIFSDLLAWQKAHSLTIEIYQITNAFPAEERFGMISQLRRSSSSVGANIAEGFSRYHFKEKVRFYYQARGSAGEVLNFLLLAQDLNFVSNDICEDLVSDVRRVMQLINGLIRSVERQYAAK